MVTVAGGLLAVDGLASSRRAIKADPFEKLACTITADPAAIGHVAAAPSSAVSQCTRCEHSAPRHVVHRVLRSGCD